MPRCLACIEQQCQISHAPSLTIASKRRPGALSTGAGGRAQLHPTTCEPGMSRVVACLPDPLVSGAGHHIEVVEMVSGCGHTGSVVAAGYEEHISIVHRDRGVDRTVFRVRAVSRTHPHPGRGSSRSPRAGPHSPTIRRACEAATMTSSLPVSAPLQRLSARRGRRRRRAGCSPAAWLFHCRGSRWRSRRRRTVWAGAPGRRAPSPSPARPIRGGQLAGRPRREVDHVGDGSEHVLPSVQLEHVVIRLQAKTARQRHQYRLVIPCLERTGLPAGEGQGAQPAVVPPCLDRSTETGSGRRSGCRRVGRGRLSLLPPDHSHRPVDDGGDIPVGG